MRSFTITKSNTKLQIYTRITFKTLRKVVPALILIENAITGTNTADRIPSNQAEINYKCKT